MGFSRESASPGSQFGGGKAVGRGRQGDECLCRATQARSVEIDAADDGIPDPRWQLEEILSNAIADEALIDAA